LLSGSSDWADWADTSPRAELSPRKEGDTFAFAPLGVTLGVAEPEVPPPFLNDGEADFATGDGAESRCRRLWLIEPKSIPDTTGPSLRRALAAGGGAGAGARSTSFTEPRRCRPECDFDVTLATVAAAAKSAPGVSATEVRRRLLPPEAGIVAELRWLEPLLSFAGPFPEGASKSPIAAAEARRCRRLVVTLALLTAAIASAPDAAA
jgi:hypothetical protein